MAGIWRSYMRVLQKYPLPTMCSTTGTLMATGDALSQLVFEKVPVKKYDAVRSSRFFVLGFCAMGPMMRYWYLVLEKLYSGTRFAPLKMLLTDQTLGAPVVLFTFVAVLGVLRGENKQQITDNIKRDYATILINNYKVWPAAQAINFYFLPLQHRVLFVNFIALGWNTYLAWVTERKEHLQSE